MDDASERLKCLLEVYFIKHHLSQAQFARKAHVSTKNISEAMRGRLNLDFESMTRREKKARIDVVARIARCCEKDPQEFLESLGVSKKEYDEANPRIVTRSLLADELLATTITQDDLDYLASVMSGLKQPMTVNLAVQLLKLRQAPKSG